MTLNVKVLAALLWSLALMGAYGLGARHVASDPGRASVRSFERAMAERDPVRRSFEISRSLRDIDAAGITDVVRAVESAGFWFDPQEHQLLMAAWVQIDQTSPVDWAFARPGTLTWRARIAVVDALGFADPPRARWLISSLDLSDDTELLHLHMIQGWARSEHKDSLTRYIVNLPQGIPRQQATKALISEILKGGADELIAWVDAIPVDAERQFKRAAFQKAANAIARVAPTRAALWLDEHLGNRYAVGAPKVVAIRWLERDPPAAMDWLVTITEKTRGADLVKQSFSSWTKIDSEAAEQWALAASPAPGVDPAVRVLVRRYFDTRPAEAMEWAHRIHDPTTRTRVLASAGRSWLRADPEAFMTWLPESGLESQIRDLILNTARKVTPDRAEADDG